MHVPYKGPGAALADVMSGQVPLYFMNVLGALPLVKAGKLRALGVTSAERSPIAPELPTIAEAGLRGLRHDELVRHPRAGRDAAGTSSRSFSRRSRAS